MEIVKNTEQMHVPRLLRKSNELINARYSLPLNAQKLICLCVTKLDINKDNFMDLKIYAKDLSIIADYKNPYEELYLMGNALFESEITVKDSSGKYKLRKRWINNAEYSTGEGYITFRFNDDLKDFLLLLKEKYTVYDISMVKNFTNKYSLRIYELLLQHRFRKENVKIVEYTLEELREILVLEDMYKVYSDLKRYVLDPVVEELSKTELKNIKYTPIKKGRRVNSIRFEYTNPRGYDNKLAFADKIRDKIGAYREQLELGNAKLDSEQVLQVVLTAAEANKIALLDNGDDIEKLNPDVVTYVNEKVKMLETRKNDEFQEPIKSDFAYLMTLIKNKY